MRFLKGELIGSEAVLDGREWDEWEDIARGAVGAVCGLRVT